MNPNLIGKIPFVFQFEKFDTIVNLVSLKPFNERKKFASFPIPAAPTSTINKNNNNVGV
jgi:hypothetical protein